MGVGGGGVEKGGRGRGERRVKKAAISRAARCVLVSVISCRLKGWTISSGLKMSRMNNSPFLPSVSAVQAGHKITCSNLLQFTL